MCVSLPELTPCHVESSYLLLYFPPAHLHIPITLFPIYSCNKAWPERQRLREKGTVSEMILVNAMLEMRNSTKTSYSFNLIHCTILLLHSIQLDDYSFQKWLALRWPFNLCQNLNSCIADKIIIVIPYSAFNLLITVSVKTRLVSASSSDRHWPNALSSSSIDRCNDLDPVISANRGQMQRLTIMQLK